MFTDDTPVVVEETPVEETPTTEQTNDTPAAE